MKTTTLPASRDKLLFTPGPLTTSLSVKQAMLHDAGSWHFEFNDTVSAIRNSLLEIAGVSRNGGWEAVLLQGSGTFGVEAVFQTCVPPGGKVAVLTNGAYGDRMVQMLRHARIDHVEARTAETMPFNAEQVSTLLEDDSAITHVAMVHCETTTGILNPIEEIGRRVRQAERVFVVDAMSSFGGLPIDLEACGIDFLVSSANKCVEGVPGFSFVLCRRAQLERCEGYARSLSLDLLAQLRGFEKNGQFRYTPPTHALLAFHQALAELRQEGGVEGRVARYRRNHSALIAGMAEIGLKPLLETAVQSPIITAFHYPQHTSFEFEGFYRRLSERGHIIYPGKLTTTDTFRIGTIGRLFPSDIEQLLYAVGCTLEEMGVSV